MLGTNDFQLHDQGKRAGGDWVTSIATQLEMRRLSEMTPSPGAHTDDPINLPDWHDQTRWPTLYPLLKHRTLTAVADPWLAGFIEGAVEATGRLH